MKFVVETILNLIKKFFKTKCANNIERLNEGLNFDSNVFLVSLYVNVLNYSWGIRLWFNRQSYVDINLMLYTLIQTQFDFVELCRVHSFIVLRDRYVYIALTSFHFAFI